MDKIKKTIKKAKIWIKQNPKEAAILAAILIVGAFLRLYRIGEYMTFLGDEGRDVIVVGRLLTEGDLILVGPGTSIGNMYLGPLYYYMMAPALFLARYSPIGPAIQIALLGIATIFFVWLVGREWFGKRVAFIAAFLYTIAPTVIIYSRSSWNPNIMPFFSLLCIYGLWKIWQKSEWKWLVITAVSFAFTLQSHYLGLILIPILGIFWLLTFLKSRKTKKTKSFLRHTVHAVILFAVLMSPLIVFDARHNWRNFSSMKKFFTERQTTVSARPWTGLPKVIPITQEINTRLLAGHDEEVGKWLTVGIFAGTFWLVTIRWKKIKKGERQALILIGTWLVFSVIGLATYKQHIYDHYYGFFFPAPFLLVGVIAKHVSDKWKTFGKLAIIVALGCLVFVNLKNSPLRYSPNKQMQRSEEVAEKIINEAGDEKFNLAVIAERNYEGAYQYFLEKEGAPIIMIDPQKAEETITELLFVVCELPDEKCNPVNNPKAEIANFGWSKIDEQWVVAGTILYKLVPAR
ncbi:glycosyltransferase family 39 protein [Patescibacteria group bacterium]|nr:glycosyltransferase family 39 protein [Patescibacteria group bacterium]MBU0776926.1 glycosyltransferase family 39 protein [Patescibacteria group bacterium]MBU0845958.1 glycosyltransferase family 39 protein [Patescibacteria group bacterium]MBU0922505.1 glycosyltransferase family 39 protein [Patescibacteria group bacterium]MBU1066317.1 glycosyltransferase family 39 protein [Patescibacteria group bacterium]